MKTKSLNLDVIVSPEIGLIIFILGFILVFYGHRQGKKKYEFDNLPIIKPAVKEILGIFFLIVGFIQLLPFFGNI